jgi:hypothetical protein
MFKKLRIFNSLFLAISIFALCAVTNVYANRQEVYLAEEPVPLMINKLRSQGISSNDAMGFLKNNLPKITPELAREKFGIRWKEERELSREDMEWHVNFISTLEEFEPWRFSTRLSFPYIYPAIAVCYMGPEVGYGLFAMENIKKGDIVTEYVGEYIKHIKGKKRSPHAVTLAGGEDIDIDAQYVGNAARFASHLPTMYDLTYMYKYKFYGHASKEQVALSNVMLINCGHYLLMAATENIKAGEQIGFYYEQSYGSELSTWPDEPYLFNKQGEIIPRTEYQAMDKMIFFFSEEDAKNGSRYAGINRNHLLVNKKVVGKYIFYSLDELKKEGIGAIVINPKTLEKELAKPRDRLTCSSFLLPLKTDVFTFIAFLEEIDKYNFSKEEKKDILKEAKEGRFSKAKRMLESLKKEFGYGEVEL